MSLTKRAYFFIFLIFTVTLSIVSWALFGTSMKVNLDRGASEGACIEIDAIRITVTNYTFSTLLRASSKLEIFQNGRTSDVSRSKYDPFKNTIVFDMEVKPFSSKSLCFSIPYIANYINSYESDGKQIPQFSLAETMRKINARYQFEKEYQIYLTEKSYEFISN